MVAIDFNLIYKNEDKNNSILNRVMMGRFKRLINDIALKELPLPQIDIIKHLDSPTLVKLDKVL